MTCPWLRGNLEALRHAKRRAARPRVLGDLRFVWAEGPPRWHRQHGPSVASAHGQIDRPNTIARAPFKNPFDYAVLQAVIRQNPDAPAGLKQINRGLERVFEVRQLVIDLDAEGLKNPRECFASLRPPTVTRNHPGQIARAIKRSVLANRAGDAPGHALFAISFDDAGQVSLRRRIDHVAGRAWCIRAHSHIERAISLKTEPAIRLVDLVRRDPQIEQNTRDRRDAPSGQDRAEIPKRCSHRADPICERAQMFGRNRDGTRIAVDADQFAGFSQALEQPFGVPTPAQRGIDVYSIGVGYEVI